MEIPFFCESAPLPPGADQCRGDSKRKLSSIALRLACALLVGGAFLNASVAGPTRSEICEAAPDCIGKGLLCVLVQVPRAQRKAVLSSDAFEDMESQVDALEARRHDVRYAVSFRDLSEFFSGLKSSERLRTVFLGNGGAALVFDGLFVDDPAPIELYFQSGTLPKMASEELTQVKLALRIESCAK